MAGVAGVAGVAGAAGALERLVRRRGRCAGAVGPPVWLVDRSWLGSSDRSLNRRQRRDVDQNADVDDLPSAISAGSDGPDPASSQRGEAAPDGPWPIDAALGAASIAAKVAGGVASTVVSAAPVRAAEGVARWLAQPLVRQGHAVRESIASDGVPAVKDAVRKMVPPILDVIDLNAVISAVDVGELIDGVDIDGIVGRVDIDGIVGRVDIGAIVDQVDIDRIIGQLDLNALIANVDIDGLIGELDMNGLLDGLDLNHVLAQIDINVLVAQLDLNSVMDRIDVDGLIANTEMGAIIVRSTGGAASEALDAVRSQGVSIDTVVARIANRLLRRDPDSLPSGPPLLVDAHLALPAGSVPSTSPADAAAPDTNRDAVRSAADRDRDESTGGGPR